MQEVGCEEKMEGEEDNKSQRVEKWKGSGGEKK